jgi:hypothetical protein
MAMALSLWYYDSCVKSSRYARATESAVERFVTIDNSSTVFRVVLPLLEGVMPGMIPPGSEMGFVKMSMDVHDHNMAAGPMESAEEKSR